MIAPLIVAGVAGYSFPAWAIWAYLRSERPYPNWRWQPVVLALVWPLLLVVGWLSDRGRW